MEWSTCASQSLIVRPYAIRRSACSVIRGRSVYCIRIHVIMYYILSISSSTAEFRDGNSTTHHLRDARVLYDLARFFCRCSSSVTSPASRNLPSSVSNRGKYPPLVTKFSIRFLRQAPLCGHSLWVLQNESRQGRVCAILHPIYSRNCHRETPILQIKGVETRFWYDDHTVIHIPDILAPARMLGKKAELAEALDVGFQI